MNRDLNIHFSNHLEVLYQKLKAALYPPFSNPFTKRLVIVYGPAMKSWLMLKMAQDPELEIAAGLEFIYLNQAFETLLHLFQKNHRSSIPSLLELELRIEKEILLQLRDFDRLNAPDQNNWRPLIRYLKFDPRAKLSLKIEKRLIGLSHQIAKYFKEYGRFAGSLVEKWDKNAPKNWQEHLWQLIFGNDSDWDYLSRALKQPLKSEMNYQIHFFSLSFISHCEFEFIQRLAKEHPVHYYMISPCAVFWSDIRSDKESHYLLSYWESKKGKMDGEIDQLEELLADRNPLLANFGRMGREMVSQIEASSAKTHADYLLPSSVSLLAEDTTYSDDLFYYETNAPLTLLQAVQADILLTRNPIDKDPLTIQAEDRSIQLHRAPNKRREIEIAYHNLLQLMDRYPHIEPRDIIVMAPQIAEYVPYIQKQFEKSESQIACQILDLGLQAQSEIVQGFLLLLEMSEGRWDNAQLMQLFEYPSFQRKHQLTEADYRTLYEWIEEAGIRWGDDALHRNELLQRRHCFKGMDEDTYIGTWDFGLSRLLLGLTYLLDANASVHFQAYPCNALDFTETELLGNWISLLHSLRDDLLPLQDGSMLTGDDWANYLNCLLESYFQPDFHQSESIEEYRELQKQFKTLQNAVKTLNGYEFPFESIKVRLNDLFEQRGIVYRENYIQSVRFCSLIPLRSIPAKVIVLLGMHEGAFPRVELASSLNLAFGQSGADYSPSSIDYDRYLFLEALHSTQNYLLISYLGYDSNDNKELKPSLIIEELFSYLDRNYLIGMMKPSEKCCYFHPLNSFDPRYFHKETRLNNFSRSDYQAAGLITQGIKNPPYRFIKNFDRLNFSLREVFPNESLIDIKHLNDVARDPIKYHLNRVLEIYIENPEDRILKTEEALSLSPLDRFIFKKEGLKESKDVFFHRIENEGRLPLGLFKKAALKKISQDMEKLQERLTTEALSPQELFEIEFSAGCQEPMQIGTHRWLFPSITLNYTADYRLHVVGKLSHMTLKGLFAIGADQSIEKIWRFWPQFLVSQYASKYLQEAGRNLILSDHPSTKVPFFEDPEPYLKQFIRYFGICHTQFSPLMPKWLTHFHKKNAEGLQKEMDKIFDSFGGYPNRTLQWIFDKDHLPDAKDLIAMWGEEAEALLNDIITHWK